MVNKRKKLELLLMAFSETYIMDILKKYLAKKINKKEYHKLSKWLLDKTMIEIEDLFGKKL